MISPIIFVSKTSNFEFLKDDELVGGAKFRDVAFEEDCLTMPPITR